MSTPKSIKPKSPPAPSRNLETCFNDAKKLYSEYSHGTFATPEIGKVFGGSSTSGPFKRRLFSLTQFGLLDGEKGTYKVADVFKTMNSSATDSAEFKAAAVSAIRHARTFSTILDGSSGKLPSTDALATRLETQMRFNADGAKLAAKVLTESLRFAGVLDANGNILPVRGGTTPLDTGEGSEEQEQFDDVDGGLEDEALDATKMLRTEIPLGTRKVLVRYPHDLTEDEATKIGKVLAAIVS